MGVPKTQAQFEQALAKAKAAGETPIIFGDLSKVDLGYTFKRHLRIGASVSYVERRSTVDDFGIDGLLVGGTITFTP